MIRAFLRYHLFRLRQKPPAEDWRRGDLAECLQKGGWSIVATGQPCPGPEYGQIVRVASVDCQDGLVGLALEGWPAWWTPNSFRKITPRQREACNEGFRLRMKGLRPRVDA